MARAAGQPPELPAAALAGGLRAALVGANPPDAELQPTVADADHGSAPLPQPASPATGTGPADGVPLATAQTAETAPPEVTLLATLRQTARGAATSPHTQALRKHFSQTKPERSTAESTPAGASAPAPPELPAPSVAELRPAAVSLGQAVQPAAGNLTVEPANSARNSGPGTDPAVEAASTKPPRSYTTMEIKPAGLPVATAPPEGAPAERQSATPEEMVAAPATPVLTTQPDPQPTYQKSGAITEPVLPSGRPAVRVAMSTGEEDTGVAPGIPIPRAAAQPAQSPVETVPPDAPDSQDVIPSGSPLQTGMAGNASVLASAAETEPAGPAGGRIAAPPAGRPQPAKVFARNSGNPSIASAVPWVPPVPTAAQEALANRMTPLQQTLSAPLPASPQSPGADVELTVSPASVSPVSAAPPAGKAAARQAGGGPKATQPFPAAEDAASAGALEPLDQAAQSDSLAAAQPSPMPVPANIVAAPAPVLPSVPDTPTVPQDRVTAARLPGAETTRASRGLEGVVLPGLASFADRPSAGAPAVQPAAGPPAFEALLTPQPRGASADEGTTAPGSTAPVSTASAATGRAPVGIEVPTAEIAPRIAPSESLSGQAATGQPGGGDREPAAEQTPRPTSRVEKADTTARSEAGRKQAASPADSSPAAASGAGSAAAVRPTPVAEPANGETRAAATAPRAPETADRAADANLAPEAPKPSAAARNMQFSLGAGDQRVEVRVAERDGELHVAVHTPDQRLAGNLRDDLPSLAARLESAGLRTETWHAGSSDGAGRQRLVETSSQTPSQDSQDQPGQDGRRRQDDPPPQRAKRPEDSSHPQRDQKDFQWHLTSLR